MNCQLLFVVYAFLSAADQHFYRKRTAASDHLMRRFSACIHLLSAERYCWRYYSSAICTATVALLASPSSWRCCCHVVVSAFPKRSGENRM